MARLVTCGFENQNTTFELPGNSALITTGGTFSISTSTKRNGASSMRLVGSSTSNAYLDTRIAGTYSNLYARVYVRFAAFPNADTFIMQFTNSTGGGQYGIKFKTAGSTLGLYSGVTQYGSDSSALSLNTWYGIGLSSEAAGSPTQKAYFWADGASYATFATGNINTADVGRVYVGSIPSSAVVDMYMDDFVVNDNSGSYQNSFPPNGSIITLRPNAAGDNNQWNKYSGAAGDANNYQLVSEVPVVTTNSYIERSTGQPIDDYNVESPTGLSAGDVINCVVANGVIGSSSGLAGADNTVIYRIKGPSGTLVESASRDASDSAYDVGWDDGIDGLPTYVNPDDSAAWSVSDLTNVQVGIKTGTSASTPNVRVAALYLAVDYTPSNAIVKSISTTWDVGQTIAKSISTTWDVNRTVAKAASTTWDVLQTVAKSLSTTWDVASDKINVSKNISTTWDVLSTVSKSISTTWDVESSLITVDKSVSTTWDVLSAVTKSISTTWNIAKTVTKSLSDQWAVGNIVNEVEVFAIAPISSTVPSAYPIFTLLPSGATPLTEYTIQVQIATDQFFASTVASFSASPLFIGMEVPEKVQSDTSIANGDYFWRARIIDGASVSTWSIAERFTVDTTYGGTAEYCSFNVLASGTSDYELWFTDPASIAPGESLTLYGYGLDQGTDTITLDGVPVATTSWNRIAADPNAYTVDRSIDRISRSLDAEHDEIVFTVPAGDYGVGTVIGVVRA